MKKEKIVKIHKKVKFTIFILTLGDGHFKRKERVDGVAMFLCVPISYDVSIDFYT